MQDLSLSGNEAATSGLRRFIHNLVAKTREPQNAEFLRGLLLLGGALFVLTIVSYLLTTNWAGAFPRDKVTLVVGRDFLNLWMYGVAAFEPDPARYYDLATYNEGLAKLLGPGYPGQNWPNPPTALVIMAPFGLLNYLPALLAWFSVSGLAFYLAGRDEVTDLRTLLIVLISPAALMCVLSGQSSLLTTAALLTIFACLDTRPILAGVLIGLLSVKPQLGILFPFLLVASSRWRVFFAAAATTLLLLLASIAIGGIESWQSYITKALPLQRAVLQLADGMAMPFQPSIFMNVRGVVGNRAGEIVQFAFTLAAVGAVIAAFRWRRDADKRMLQALFFACTVSASPYMGDYDLLPLTFAAVALLAEEKLDGTGRRLAQLVFWAPALQLLFGNLQLPGPGFIAPLFAAYLLRELFKPAPVPVATA
jgi:Glycosyltransferase family 87